MLRIVSIVLISKKRFKILLSNMLWRKELIENDGGPHWFAHDRIWEGLGLAWLGKPGMLPSTGLQRVRHDWMTELNWTCLAWLFICFMWLQLGWLGQEDPLPRPLFQPHICVLASPGTLFSWDSTWLGFSWYCCLRVSGLCKCCLVSSRTSVSFSELKFYKLESMHSYRFKFDLSI